MIVNTFFIVLFVAASVLAAPVSEEESDYISRLPGQHHPSLKQRERIPGSTPTEIPQDILNKLSDKDVHEQLENIILFLQDNEDLLEYVDKEDAKDIFKGIENIMQKVVNAAKKTIEEEHNSIKDSASSLKDAGKQIWQTGTQLGKTGLDLTFMIPKFGLNVLNQDKKQFFK